MALDPIELGTGQSIAAYWSISWPSIAASLLVCLVQWVPVSLHPIGGIIAPLNLVSSVLCFSCQALLITRLTSKTFKTFFICVVREGDPPRRAMLPAEIGSVCLRVLWPQIAFLTAASFKMFYFGEYLSAGAISSMSAIALAVQFLIVGPFAIQWALKARYPGFRLQAFRREPHE